MSGARSDVVTGLLVVHRPHCGPVAIGEKRVGIAAPKPARNGAEIAAQVVVQEAAIGRNHDSPRPVVLNLIVERIGELPARVHRRR